MEMIVIWDGDGKPNDEDDAAYGGNENTENSYAILCHYWDSAYNYFINGIDDGGLPWGFDGLIIGSLLNDFLGLIDNITLVSHFTSSSMNIGISTENETIIENTMNKCVNSISELISLDEWESYLDSSKIDARVADGRIQLIATNTNARESYRIYYNPETNEVTIIEEIQ